MGYFLFLVLIIALIATSINAREVLRQNIGKCGKLSANVRKNAALKNTEVRTALAAKHQESERSGFVPRELIPLYVAFALDSVALGLFVPVLPFHAMANAKASAIQLSYVMVAGNLGLALGASVMGPISDMFGRKPVAVAGLVASFVSYVSMARAKSVAGLVVARAVSNISGGILPVLQSAIADVSRVEDRGCYFGRTVALFGFAFLFGPLLGQVLTGLSSHEKLMLAGILSGCGAIITALSFDEPMDMVTGKWQTKHKEGLKQPSSKCQQQSSGRSMRVNLLFVVSFLMVYGFSSESIYAVFMKEKLGHGEKEMSQLLMVNGLASAMAQVFVLPRVQDRKLGTLMSCTVIFTLGMIGIGAIHSPALHYIIFTVHLVAYMLADTTVASLLTEFSPPHAQGLNLSTNQAVQAVAKIVAPIVTGVLYMRFRDNMSMPFFLGAVAPAFACLVIARLNLVL